MLNCTFHIEDSCYDTTITVSVIVAICIVIVVVAGSAIILGIQIARCFYDKLCRNDIENVYVEDIEEPNKKSDKKSC